MLALAQEKIDSSKKKWKMVYNLRFRLGVLCMELVRIFRMDSYLQQWCLP